MNKSVSIIIPCYNAAPFLKETIDSAINQTVPPAEIILIDDGSTDGSAAIAESYGPPVRVIRQANQGESVAMNVGLARTMSDYIVFLGADDVLSPNLLELQLRAVEGVPNGVACTGFAFFMDDIARPFNETLPTADAFFPGIIAANLAPASCWLTPRELIIQAGCYHTTQQYFEDWDLWWRVALAGGVYVPVATIGFYYRQHAKSQLASLAAAERAYGHAWLMERMCREFLERPDLLNAHGEQLFWAGLTALRASRACGVTWDRLRLLTGILDELLRRDPPGVERSVLARAARIIGLKKAEMLRTSLGAKDAAPSYRPAWLTTPAASNS